VKQSLERSLCQQCPYCSGSGMVKSVATTCYTIYHEIEKMAGHLDERADLMIRVHPDVARALRESESDVMDEIRHLLKGIDVIVKADASMHIEHFNLVN
jgi:ribonuclease G